MNKNAVKKFVKDHKIELTCACLGGIASALVVVKVKRNMRDRVKVAPDSLLKYGIKTVLEDSVRKINPSIMRKVYSVVEAR